MALRYRMARDPKSCTAKEILDLTDENLTPVTCLESGSAPCAMSAKCLTLPVWKGLDKVVKDYLSNITIQDIIDRKVGV